MSTTATVELGNGEVRYYGKVDAVPPSTEKRGNVTINNAGRDGVPAYYEVSFNINVTFGEGRRTVTNHLIWDCLVDNEDDRARYRDIEAAAARQIAPMLRVLADQVQATVEEYDAKHGLSG